MISGHIGGKDDVAGENGKLPFYRVICLAMVSSLLMHAQGLYKYLNRPCASPCAKMIMLACVDRP